MDIIWSPEAKADMQPIFDYVSSDSNDAAGLVVETIFNFTNSQLDVFPNSGRPGRLENTLELVVPHLPYFIPYQISSSGKIEILRVYHTSRLWPA
jgi:plasmid stabilization system protein ParE